MEEQSHYQRVDADAPDRCQFVTAHGQCLMKQFPGSKYCKAHSMGAERRMEDEKVRNYRLTQWKARVGDFADSKEVKSIREEIGILRLVLETRLNQCQDNEDLLLHSHAIGDLVTKIEKTVGSCHRLESQMGQLLDRQSILKFASQVVTVISDVTNALLLDGVITEEAASKINSTVADELIKAMQPADDQE